MHSRQQKTGFCSRCRTKRGCVSATKLALLERIVYYFSGTYPYVTSLARRQDLSSAFTTDSNFVKTMGSHKIAGASFQRVTTSLAFDASVVEKSNTAGPVPSRHAELNSLLFVCQGGVMRALNVQSSVPPRQHGSKYGATISITFA